jgi:hypothetical protein
MQGAEDEENEISHLFQSYLQEMKVGIAFDQILGHLLDEEFSDAETDYVVHEILMPEVVCLFANKYRQQALKLATQSDQWGHFLEMAQTWEQLADLCELSERLKASGVLLTKPAISAE